MEDAKKYRLALTGFIIMVVLNVAILVSIWIMRPPQFHRRRPHGNRPFRVEHFMKNRLHLNKEQRKKFNQLRHQQIARSRPIIRDIRKKRGDLINLLKSDQIDSARADSLIEGIGRDQIQLQHQIFNHFAQLRQLCTPSQKKKFNRLMQRVLHRYGRPPRP
ncbi:MAG TPA: Spy/CpxP family protein refolding chaperone [Balneolaceae bacterium]|nr:Spy/CpxP family protein refolding chaperone [Balneolaceae bacterium]